MGNKVKKEKASKKPKSKLTFYDSAAQFERTSGKPGVDPSEFGRTPFRKDFSRLLHAPAFRRLQGKTQLYPGSESDFFRNRLTHSLEVAQIARGIASRLNSTAVADELPGAAIDEDLVEFAAIAHDLGHPPFGHNGEHALDELMIDHGGFEGNAQTLRILSAVERKIVRGKDGEFSTDYGLDLTYRSLASVLKYDKEIPMRRAVGERIVKGYYNTEAGLVAEIKKRVAPKFKGEEFKTIECSIMDLADDIAYSTYDLEDSLHAGFLTPLELVHALIQDRSIAEKVKAKTDKALLAAGHSGVIDDQELITTLGKAFGIRAPRSAVEAFDEGSISNANAILMNVESWNFNRGYANGLARTQFTAERVGRLIAAVELIPNHKFPQLSSVKMSRPELLQVEILKHLNYELVVRSSRLAVVEYRGKEVVQKIFKALLDSDGSLLPEDWRSRFAAEKGKAVPQQHRVICDYVACMTDKYAAELYQRLFDEGPTMFKPL